MHLPAMLKYAPSVLFPLISAGMWLAMLLAMFITWEVQGHKHLPSMEDTQHIAYISDIGATGLKPLFITGAVITTVFLDLSFASERWLRHTGRLARNRRGGEKVLSGLAILFAIAGTAGLILLSIFDTLHHHNLHDGFLLLFIAGYVISACFICAEYQRLGIHFRQLAILRISFWMKLVFILVEVVLAIIFAVMTFTNRTNVGAVVEWVIALIFTFWVLSFAVDLWPAVKGRQQDVEESVVGNDLENGVVEKRKPGVADGAGVANGANVLNGVAYINGNGHAQVAENF